MDGPGRARLRAKALAAIAASGFAIGLPPAGAQSEPVEQQPLPPATSVLHRLREIVAHGGARPAPVPDDPTAFTTVVRAADYDGEAATTEELLSRVPGVQLRRFGGPGAPSELSIRGSTASQVLVAFDGIRLDTAQSGRTDPSTVPLALLERIEVARGGGSVQAGSNAIGGVVDLVPLQPGGPTRTRLQAAHGAHGTWQGAAARTGSAAGFDYALAYDALHSDGDWHFERLPRETGIGVVQPVPRRAERINNESERHATLLTLGRTFGEQVHVTVRDHVFYQSRGAPGLDSGGTADAGQRAEAHERNLRHLGLVRLDAAELGGTPVGARLEVAHLWQRQQFRDPEPVVRLGRTVDVDDRWIPRVGLLIEPIGGVRVRGNLERAWRAPSFDELYFPDQGFLRGNPGLQPEESTDGDIGIELAFERLGILQALHLEAVWFQRDIDESIVWVLVSPTLVEPRNTGPASARGWELSGSLRLLDWIELAANHTRLDAELDATGTPLPGRAERQTNVRVAVGPPSGGARAILETQDVSEIPVTPTGGTRLPERRTWDFALWLDLNQVPGLGSRLPSESLRLGFEVANLTDEIARDAENFPQPGRSWKVRLEGTW